MTGNAGFLRVPGIIETPLYIIYIVFQVGQNINVYLNSVNICIMKTRNLDFFFYLSVNNRWDETRGLKPQHSDGGTLAQKYNT